MSDETRDKVMELSRDDFGGVSADETIRRLIDEHWQTKAIAAVRRVRDEDPAAWADYLAEAEYLAGADAAVSDAWQASA